MTDEQKQEAEPDEPTLIEVAAMHLWKTLPPEVGVYLRLPDSAPEKHEAKLPDRFIEDWEDCEKDFGVQHEWVLGNFQNLNPGNMECQNCRLTRSAP